MADNNTERGLNEKENMIESTSKNIDLGEGRSYC